MPEPLKVTGHVNVTIDAGNGDIPLGQFDFDQDGQADNGSGWAGFISISINGVEYGALCISRDEHGPCIELGTYTLAFDQWMPQNPLHQPTKENTPE